MTEEVLEPDDTKKKAIDLMGMLINFDIPKVASNVQCWLESVKNIQTAIATLWRKDEAVMVYSLTALYDTIAIKQTVGVSPAVWSVLDLVEKRKICEIVDTILNNPKTNESFKVKNALLAIVDGLCQFGPRAPKLQDWTIAIVRGLEVRSNYHILNAVAESTIEKLLVGFQIPLYRQLIYPVFRRFFYSSVSPRVFLKIINSVPNAITELEKDINDENTRICLNDFGGLVTNLMVRHSRNDPFSNEYAAVKAALRRIRHPEFEASTLPLWDEDDVEVFTCDIQQVYTISYETSKTLVYKGLTNQGNTCFMNSVLQMLYMTTRFRNEILMKEVDASEQAASDLQELFAFMQESDRHVLLPFAVMHSTLPSTFRRGHQQDSSEYLTYLLETLHENEKRVIRRRKRGVFPRKDTLEEKMEEDEDVKEEETGSVEEQKVGSVEGIEAGSVEEQKVGSVEGIEAGSVEEQKVGSVEGIEAGSVEEQKVGSVEGIEAGSVEEQKVGLVEEQEAGSVEEQKVGSVEGIEAGSVEEQKVGSVEEQKVGSVEGIEAGSVEEQKVGSVEEQQVALDEYTIVEKLFAGNINFTTICSYCEKSFEKTDTFRDLHLSMPDEQISCDLQDLINNSLQPEELCGKDQYDCSNCGTKRNAVRKQAIVRAPEHLILTLKLFRFDPVRRRRLKIQGKLNNSYTINLPVFSSSQSEPKIVTYELKAVVLHSGASLDGGHYFSAAVDHSGQWYVFNDARVTVARCEWSAENGTPYILILRQSDVTDPPKKPLQSRLQMLVERDNESFMQENRIFDDKTDEKDDYDDDDDCDGSTSSSDSFGHGPPLVF